MSKVKKAKALPMMTMDSLKLPEWASVLTISNTWHDCYEIKTVLLEDGVPILECTNGPTWYLPKEFKDEFLKLNNLQKATALNISMEEMDEIHAFQRKKAASLRQGQKA